MRAIYHEELAGIADDLIALADQVSSAVIKATTALLDADLALAEQVISADADIDAAQHAGETRILETIARQAPVAGDLRALAASLRMLTDLERAGDYAAHIADVARRRHPECAVPLELRNTVLEIGHAAQRIVIKASSAIATRDPVVAGELDRDDDAMDNLHRRVLGVLLAGDWSHGVEAAVDITLLGRYYERYADHAVSTARQVIFLVTGSYPE